MKLIVQIPCYNEEQTLIRTVEDIPHEIEGIDRVEILIIDDGSTDRTVEVAKNLGIDHILRNKGNKGLAFSFINGINACLELGADIIVNTDGDNQYKGEFIPRLIAPLLSGEADIVVGDRKTDNIDHFSSVKKRLQKLGSLVVRLLSGTDVPDAVSGFRAFSRDAAMRTNIVSAYSYTVETIIQAGNKKLTVKSVQVETNPQTRPSRLMKSMPKFIANQLNTMVRMYTMFKPMRVFFIIGFFFLIAAMVPLARFLVYYFMGMGSGHIQSLIYGAILFIIGFQVMMIALLGDVISFNRKLIEETLYRVKKMEFDFPNRNKDLRVDRPGLAAMVTIESGDGDEADRESDRCGR